MKVTNTYQHREDGVTELTITKRDGSIHICLIDTNDFEDISKYTWTIAPLGYVTRFFLVDRKGITVGIHRHLNGDLPKGICVDHINREKLDNRRCNLRIVTYSQNTQNVRARLGKAIPVKGLCFQTVDGVPTTVRAKVQKCGVQKLRTFSIQAYGEDRAIELAAEWITSTRSELHGEYAHQ